ncbi:MAG: helix-turn-helix domain-containing protein [Saprospiraceae bacterium]|nr:helix-turn-helix domain-containing protein [Saprospiraceae bacterium]
MNTLITSLTEAELVTRIEDALRKVLTEQATSKNLNSSPQYPVRMNITQAASYLSLSVQTIYSKTSLRTLPHIKKGKRLYFERDALDKWLLEGKQKTVTELLAETDEYLANGGKKKR